MHSHNSQIIKSNEKNTKPKSRFLLSKESKMILASTAIFVLLGLMLLLKKIYSPIAMNDMDDNLNKLWNLDTNAIQNITIRNENPKEKINIKIKRPKHNPLILILSDDIRQYQHDFNKIETLLNMLQNTHYEQKIESVHNNKAFGFYPKQQPWYQIKLSNSEVPEQLLFKGNTTPDQSGLYVKTEPDSSTVYILPLYKHSALEQSLFKLREKTILKEYVATRYHVHFFEAKYPKTSDSFKVIENTAYTIDLKDKIENLSIPKTLQNKMKYDPETSKITFLENLNSNEKEWEIVFKLSQDKHYQSTMQKAYKHYNEGKNKTWKLEGVDPEQTHLNKLDEWTEDLFTLEAINFIDDPKQKVSIEKEKQDAFFVGIKGPVTQFPIPLHIFMVKNRAFVKTWSKDPLYEIPKYLHAKLKQTKTTLLKTIDKKKDVTMTTSKNK